MQTSSEQMANVPPEIAAFSIIIIRDRAAILEKDIHDILYEINRRMRVAKTYIDLDMNHRDFCNHILGRKNRQRI